MMFNKFESESDGIDVTGEVGGTAWMLIQREIVSDNEANLARSTYNNSASNFAGIRLFIFKRQCSKSNCCL